MSRANDNQHGNTKDLSAVRIDRWLWAARFFKTRSLAKTAIEGGKVHVDGQRVKPAKEIQIGQQLQITRGHVEQIVIVAGLSERRGPAKVAVTLYEETQASVEQRQRLAAQRRMQNAGLTVPTTRPTKKGRRDLRKLKMDSGADE